MRAPSLLALAGAPADHDRQMPARTRPVSAIRKEALGLAARAAVDVLDALGAQATRPKLGACHRRKAHPRARPATVYDALVPGRAGELGRHVLTHLEAAGSDVGEDGG